jgi:hypothetical protein
LASPGAGCGWIATAITAAQDTGKRAGLGTFSSSAGFFLCVVACRQRRQEVDSVMRWIFSDERARKVDALRVIASHESRASLDSACSGDSHSAALAPARERCVRQSFLLR